MARRARAEVGDTVVGAACRGGEAVERAECRPGAGGRGRARDGRRPEVEPFIGSVGSDRTQINLTGKCKTINFSPSSPIEPSQSEMMLGFAHLTPGATRRRPPLSCGPCRPR